MEFALPVSPAGFTCVEHDQTLEVLISFENQTTGRILLSPEGMTLTDCGELTYIVAESPDTEATYGDGAFRFVHNQYAYAIPVTGEVEAVENGYRLLGEQGAITLDMSAR